MELHELKEKILNNTLADDLLILCCEENYFIANQYIQAIAENKLLTIVPIENLNEALIDSLFANDEILRVLRVDVFAEKLLDYSKLKNTIIICNKVDKKLLEQLTSYVVTIPKLQAWQIIDYAKVLCPGLPEASYSELTALFNNDIYRLVNELSKINIFPVTQRPAVLQALQNQEGLDWYTFSVFKLTEAALKSDYLTLQQCLYYYNNCDFEPLGVVTLLLREYKKILFVNFNSGLTFQDLGITSKQANAIKYYYKNYTQTQLRYIIKFLTSIELNLREGKLELDKKYFLDYIIINILMYKNINE